MSSQVSPSLFTWNASLSRLRHSADDDDDFGLLTCSAENVMGVMEEPCQFKIIPAGKFLDWLLIAFLF